MMGLISYIAGSDNRRHLKKISKIADKIELLEPTYQAMSDEELKAQTEIFKKRIHENFETLEDILPEAFAVVREAGKRVLSMRHFRVQLIGGVVLHQGRIAEMGTGEGKTLVATLPSYLNALTGEGVHIVTVNDYLAKRDAEWMGKIHRFLGLTVGVAIAGMKPEDKRKAYECDITYATNNELGFDYLRDNMVLYKQDMVQRGLKYAIVDEVDSILIDEARTPLIISGLSGKSSDMYGTANRFARTLKASTNVDDEGMPIPGEESDGDFEIDKKKKAVTLTAKGVEKAEKFFAIDNLSDYEHNELNHYINNAMRAVFIMKREDDYIIQDGEVIIVDEFTGRLMIGRRYSDGLHQAIEAKENVRIQNENRTLATITFQNYFRLYKKVSGMTGTAKTEENEFRGIYGLDVVQVPPNLPSRRVDENDKVFSTIAGKLRAVVEDIKECYQRGQPVLVGTTTVEKSEELSHILRKDHVPHNVLNAKNHEREADIVAQAGKLKSITIATNMAGRGTDILLGGNAEYLAKKRMKDLGMSDETVYYATSYFYTEDPAILSARTEFAKFYNDFKEVVDKEKEEVIDLGGLRIVGTERHEARRIDNQLRGRAGRQGDIGSSVFYLSMEDDMLRLFGGDRMKNIVNFLKVDEDTPFEMKMLTNGIRNAQKNLEGRNYSIRKHVLEYDDVMNAQRLIVYGERGKVLRGESIHEQVEKMMDAQCQLVVKNNTDPKVDWQDWDIAGLNRDVEKLLLPGEEEFFTEDLLESMYIDELTETLQNEVRKVYSLKVREGAEKNIDFEEVERVIMLRMVDSKWMNHIDSMDILRREIGLKAYGQQDPVLAYKKEGFEMFDDMIARIQEETVSLLMRVKVENAPMRRKSENMEMTEGTGETQGKRVKPKFTASASKERSIGRNDPCRCGSGKKYKNCCWDKDHV
ncbi:MAG: preprotein translocase subunit SecA [Firmicutes bacterium]|nr:preprotein translocase subunit SecA [Bacillota bacterium]